MTAVSAPSELSRPAPPHVRLLPGLLLCGAVAGAAQLIEAGERLLLGKTWLEALVLAILIGTAVRSLWRPGCGWQPGIACAAKTLLEIAVVLLGASVSAVTLLAAGPALLFGIAAVVGCAIVLSFALGRALRLPARMALLVACGNAICGNSAIAAVAPVIAAEGDEVAAAIAFTAVLGVGVVLGLPILGLAFGLTGVAYGALSGLTVYAVPQVIAAAAPFGSAAVQMGTLVKLVRVLMLGPVCLALSLLAPRFAAAAKGRPPARVRPSLPQLVPWFILGFLVLMGCRSAGLVPQAALPSIATAASLLTVVAMAALGLSTDLRRVAEAGARVTAAVVLSLTGLGVLSVVLLRSLGFV